MKPQTRWYMFLTTLVFLAVAHVLSCYALIVDKKWIHRGHFGSDEGVDTVKNSCQISKLQLLIRSTKTEEVSRSSEMQFWVLNTELASRINCNEMHVM